MDVSFQVVVVGAGNAALCAAHAAREQAERVLVLEAAPRAWAGGNSYFTAGATRTTYAGLDDLRAVVHAPDDARIALTDLPPYLPADFAADLRSVTEGRCDPELTAILVGDVADAVRWLRDKGIRWRLQYDRQSFLVGGRHQFWGNLPLGVEGGGVGLMAQHYAAAEASGIEIRYEHKVVGLLQSKDGAIVGVVCDTPNGQAELRAGAVVLACGGFEADPRRRAQYLGSSWDVAKVRGTPFNTGEGLQLALDAGAQPYGNWSGCHAIQWDAAAPPFGDLELTNLLSKQSYPLAVVVNRDGRRFLDEGADFRNYTYAKYGAEVLKQPGAIAYQLFDAQTVPLLRQDEYTAPGVSKHEAATIRELAALIGVDPDALDATIREFNAAVNDAPFNPAVKDGKRTVGLTPPKSNWAQPLDTPPFAAFAVTCGITFTFGGVRIDADARVLSRAGRPIPGLHAAGELVGGIFYHNYPGGSGLSSGIVFGRRAGETAARFATGRGERGALPAASPSERGEDYPAGEARFRAWERWSQSRPSE